MGQKRREFITLIGGAPHSHKPRLATVFDF
jgi:hypothetical protein